MEVFLTVILFLVLTFWILGKLLRYLLPLILMRFQKRFTEHMGGQFGQGFRGFNSNSKQTEKEGKVTVQKQSQNSHKINKTLGDYVEFEEKNS